MGDSSADLPGFIAELRAASETIAHDLHVRLLGEVPAYRRLTPDLLVPELAANVTRALDNRDADSAEMRAVMRSGAERARQGVALTDLLRGWRLGLEVTFERATVLAARRAAPDALLVEFTRAMLQRADLATSAVADAHRTAELDMAVASAQWRERVLRALLLRDPELPDVATDELAALGLAPETEPLALCAAYDSTRAPSELAAWLNPYGEMRWANGMTAVAGHHIIGFALRLPSAPPPVLVAVGPSGEPTALPESLRMARRVLRAADLVGRTGLCRTDDLGILLPIIDDREVGRALTTRYVAPFTTDEAGRKTLETVQTYLTHRQNIDHVAATTFVHANTVRYRLRRFEQVTGADLRDPLSLSEVCWAVHRHELLDTPRHHGTSHGKTLR